ncbi:MAG: hypothetical protein M1825_002211 [Sarcosagium campestre]|nr:MAG: hypothetical protein M1825_002211 [Sarcosagium campestre]
MIATSALLLLSSYLTVSIGVAVDRQSSQIESDAKVISFDDISTTKGVANIDSPYQHLVFSPGFSIIAPNDKALDGYITPFDRNCAVSPPNALIGSRYNPNNKTDESPASFAIQNNDAGGSSASFDFISLVIKPLASPPPGTAIYIRGIPADTSRPTTVWAVSFLSGYHEPVLVTAEAIGGEWTELVNVGIWAGFGPDELDWEFCVDNLELKFHNVGTTHSNAPQQTLQDGEL